VNAGKKAAPAEDAPPAEAPETKAKKAAGGKAGGKGPDDELAESLHRLIVLACGCDRMCELRCSCQAGWHATLSLLGCSSTIYYLTSTARVAYCPLTCLGACMSNTCERRAAGMQARPRLRTQRRRPPRLRRQAR